MNNAKTITSTNTKAEAKVKVKAVIRDKLGTLFNFLNFMAK